MIEIRGQLGDTFRVVVAEGIRATRRGIRQGFFSFGNDFLISVNNNTLRQPKTGRVYTRRIRGGRRRRHQASAPGEPHANLTGTLRRSADYKLGGSDQITVGYLDNPPNYAPFVEFQTRTSAPRPTVQISMRQNMSQGAVSMEREIQRAWDEGFR